MRFRRARAPILVGLLSSACATGQGIDSAEGPSAGGSQIGGGGEGGSVISADSGGGSAGASFGGAGGTASLDAAENDVTEGSPGGVIFSDASDSAFPAGGPCGAQQACGANLKCECCSPGLKCICTTECNSDGNCHGTERCATPRGEPGFCAADGYCG